MRRRDVEEKAISVRGGVVSRRAGERQKSLLDGLKEKLYRLSKEGGCSAVCVI